MNKNIRVRIAPSPTGNLHIGTARTALFNWLFARGASKGLLSSRDHRTSSTKTSNLVEIESTIPPQSSAFSLEVPQSHQERTLSTLPNHSGEFILRIEDTDIERSDPKFEKDIIDGLKWLGLDWDGGIYRQSERITDGVYKKYIKKLLDNKKAFWCYHSKDELEQEQKEQMVNKEAPRHVCDHKNKTPEPEDKKGEKGIIRLSVNSDSKKKIEFEDIIRGHIEFNEKLIGDVSIARDGNTPLYNFAVVIDDHETAITHVIRGEDHIPNTPKQILIQQALGFYESDKLEYAHLPLILGPDRSKMSKRHGATSIIEYRELGYLPEAMVNYLALLGFTPPETKISQARGFSSIKGTKEIYDIKELIKVFDLKIVHKSGAIFDIKKLNSINSAYIKKQSDPELLETLINFSAKLSENENYNLQIIPLARERMAKLSDFKEFEFFFEKPKYNKELLKWKNRNYDEIRNSLQEVKKIVESVGVGAPDRLRKELDDLGNKLEDRGLVYWPLRVALSGQKGSPDPVEIAIILGQQKTLERIEGGVTKLKA